MNFLDKCEYVGPVGRNGRKYVVTLDSFFKGIVSKEIESNPKNRVIKEKHVKRIVDRFDFNSFGEIIGIEVQSKNGLVLQQRSGHHRAEALKIIHDKRKGWGSDGTLPVYIKVFPSEEAIEMYVTEGNVNPLKTCELLVNDDYAFCNLLKPIIGSVDLQEYRGVTFFTSRGYTNLASIVHLVSQNPTNFNELEFKSVFKNSKDIRELAEIANGKGFDVRLTPRNKEKIINALLNTVKICKEIVDYGDLLEGVNKNAKLSESARMVLRSKNFFVFLVWDKLTSGSITEITPERLARTFLDKKQELMVQAINALNNKDTKTFVDVIYRIARTKEGYERNT